MAHEQLSLPFNGKRLQTIRERAGLTRSEFARRCSEIGQSVTGQHVGHLEKNLSSPRPPLLAAFAQVVANIRDVDKEEALDMLLDPEGRVA
jgi:transcriptional regulator with XRE-family HTH domain